MTAIIKYPGAKWSIASWIISFFPKHHSYLEPFFGSGGVLFTKERSAIETINDLDDDVVNFFEWVKKDPERLAHEVYWTPYARKVYDDAWEARKTEADSLKRAVLFCACLMMGHGFRITGEKVGWKNDVQERERAYAANYWCKTPENILQAAERLRGVQIEHRPAVEIIRRFNFQNVLVYADPPYILATRHGKQYRHEMTDADHEELLDVLLARKGPALISGYDNPMYDSVLRDWHREEKIARDQKARHRTEVLWMNFIPEVQESLFAREGERHEP